MATKVFRRQHDLLSRTHRLMAHGALKKPKWYDAMLKTPPMSPPVKRGNLKEIKFPEDNLLRKYYERFPQAATTPLDMHKPVSSLPATEFVSKQLKLMNEKHMTEEEAFDAVCAEQRAHEAQQQNQGIGESVEPDSSTELSGDELKMLSLKKTFNDWVKAEKAFWNAANKRLGKKN